MKRATSALCAIIPTLILSGCQFDTAEDDKDSPEVIVVSEQISDTTNYNLDLTRNDAVYIIAPALDSSRLSVTCPNRASISFEEYISTRLRPAGVMYDPAKHFLEIANAVVPFEPLSAKQLNQSLVEAKPCIYSCQDADGSWEQCVNRDC